MADKWTLKHEEQAQYILLLLDPLARDMEMGEMEMRNVARLRAKQQMRGDSAKLTTFCRELYEWAGKHADTDELKTIQWAIQGYIEDSVMTRKRAGVMGFVFGGSEPTGNPKEGDDLGAETDCQWKRR